MEIASQPICLCNVVDDMIQSRQLLALAMQNTNIKTGNNMLANGTKIHEKKNQLHLLAEVYVDITTFIYSQYSIPSHPANKATLSK